MKWNYNDGGRRDAGFKGDTGDCVTRSIAIGTGLPYREVYDSINIAGRAAGKRSSARTGPPIAVVRSWLAERGWQWHPTMHIGSGVRCTKHVTAVIDGVIHDIGDPSREGTRCVYGYWQPAGGEI